MWNLNPKIMVLNSNNAVKAKVHKIAVEEVNDDC